MSEKTVQEQFNEVQARLAELDPNNRDNLAEISNLKVKEAELNIQLQQEQETASKMQEASRESALAVDNMVIGDNTSLRDLCIDEASYQFVSIAIKTMMNTQATKYINELSTQKAQYEDQLRAASDREAQLKLQNSNLQKALESVTAERDTLQSQSSQITLERDKAFEVRDNAAKALDEANKKIEELQASGATITQVDQSEQLKKAQEDFINSRIKVTNIRWADDIRKTHYAAELADNGETITFGRLEKGKYLEVSKEEAARFRTEQSNQSAVQDSTLGSSQTTDAVVPQIATVEDFRTAEDTTEKTTDSGNTDATAGSVVQATIEDRVAALEKAVFGSMKGYVA